MLGWYIVIFVENSNIPIDRNTSTERTRLVSWATGVSGRNWLDELVYEDKATNLGGNGYPFKYSGKASSILPFIISGPPPYEGKTVVVDYAGKDIYSLKIDEQKISQCHAEDKLIIEVWDQS